MTNYMILQQNRAFMTKNMKFWMNAREIQLYDLIKKKTKHKIV